MYICLVEAQKNQISNTTHICLAIFYLCFMSMFSCRRHKCTLYCCLIVQLPNYTQARGSIDIPVLRSPVGLTATDKRIVDDVETLVINSSEFRRNFWYLSLQGVLRSITRPSFCCCCVLIYYHLLN